MSHAKASIPPRLALPEYRPCDQLDVIKLMLDDLETATFAGQTYVMTKVVVFLESEVNRRNGVLLARPHGVIARWIEELAHWASRLMPDPREFSQRAHHLLDALASADRRPDAR